MHQRECKVSFIPHAKDKITPTEQSFDIHEADKLTKGVDDVNI